MEKKLRKKVEEYFEKNGLRCELEMLVRFTNDDYYVLAKKNTLNSSQELFTVWTMSKVDKTDDDYDVTLYWGHYDMKITDALRLICSRLEEE